MHANVRGGKRVVWSKAKTCKWQEKTPCTNQRNTKSQCQAHLMKRFNNQWPTAIIPHSVSQWRQEFDEETHNPLALHEPKYSKWMTPLRHLSKSRATLELEQHRIESMLYKLMLVFQHFILTPFFCLLGRGSLLTQACSVAEPGTDCWRLETWRVCFVPCLHNHPVSSIRTTYPTSLPL